MSKVRSETTLDTPSPLALAESILEQSKNVHPYTLAAALNIAHQG